MVLLLRNGKWLGLLLLIAGIGAFASTGHAEYCTAKWGPKTVNGVTLQGDLAMDIHPMDTDYWGASVSSADAVLSYVSARNQGWEACNWWSEEDWDNFSYRYYSNVVSVTGLGGFCSNCCPFFHALNVEGWFTFYGSGISEQGFAERFGDPDYGFCYP